jgi:hypothetical protein
VKQSLKSRLKEKVLQHWYQNLLFALAKDYSKPLDEGVDNRLGIDLSMESCPYCVKYHIKATFGQECNNCPVYKLTGKEYCSNTPYRDVIVARDDLVIYSSCNQSPKKHKTLVNAIIKEIEFLERT